MKILLVHDYGSPGGGAELQMLALRRELRERGHEARLLASDVALGDLPPEADVTCFGTRTRWQTVTSAVNPSARRALARELGDFSPDVVHVRMCLWQLSPWILPLLADTPSLYQAAVYKAVCPKGTKLLPDGSRCRVRPGVVCQAQGCVTALSWGPLMLQHRLWKRWSGVFDARVTLSQAARRVLEDGGAGSFEVIPNGVFPRPRRPPLAGPPRVAYAGRLAPEKGVGMLLGAFARVRRDVPDAVLDVAGDGPSRPALEEHARNLGLGHGKDSAVTWLGHLPVDEMEQRLSHAWVQAVPSLWHEPFGNVVTEALARGTFVVASDGGAFPEILDGCPGGRLATTGDPDAWAGALASQLTDRTETDTQGLAGRDWVREHRSVDAWVDRFVHLYRHLRDTSP